MNMKPLFKVDITPLFTDVDFKALLKKADIRPFFRKLDPRLLWQKIEIKPFLKKLDLRPALKKLSPRALFNKIARRKPGIVEVIPPGQQSAVVAQFKENMNDITCDFVIIGSGFGGSVSAMRLAQKGYTVAVLEAGKRWNAADFPKSNWNLRKYLWSPLLKCFGIQRITLLKGIMVLHGAGVGGGSLVYANTLMQPDAKVFDDSWPKSVDWKNELEPHYAEAKKMLGVTTNTMMLEAEKSLQHVSEKMGVGHTFHPTEVGVFLGEEGKTVADPFFSGAGPDRAGCVGCGSCMIGCPHNAKNTLDKNYLYFAEKWGTQVHPETTATKIIPQAEGYRVETRSTTSWFKKAGPTFRTKNVIVAAGVLGTLDLLFRNKAVHKTLPKLSDQLGTEVRTNGESLLGVTSFDKTRDLSHGIAIGAAFHPDENTKIEAVKYPSGSSAMRFLSVPFTADGNRLTRPLKMMAGVVTRFPQLARVWLARDWAKQTSILLVMQSIDQTMKIVLDKTAILRRAKLSGAATDKPIPSYLPIAQEAAKVLAEEINGEAQNIAPEVLMGTPATAHILGGCVIADDAGKGVINKQHEVFNYPGLYVCDGSVTPSNLGVNPSLTITALAERFAAAFPVADEAVFKQRQIVHTPKTVAAPVQITRIPAVKKELPTIPPINQ